MELEWELKVKSKDRTVKEDDNGTRDFMKVTLKPRDKDSAISIAEIVIKDDVGVLKSVRQGAMLRIRVDDPQTTLTPRPTGSQKAKEAAEKEAAKK